MTKQENLTTSNELDNYINEQLQTSYTLEKELSCKETTAVYLYKMNNSPHRLVYIRSTNRNDHVLRLLKGKRCDNLATIFEVCSNDNAVTILEEYIDGVSLAQVLKSKRVLPKKQAVKYILDLCGGLSFLHALGIIHRDVKPANVIISNQDAAVLIDFGIARMMHEEKQSDTINLGTVGYAAPEQFGIYQSSPATDIYALGVLLNELLTGAHPTIDTPKGRLGKIVNKCITTQISKRYQSVDELAKELKRYT